MHSRLHRASLPDRVDTYTHTAGVGFQGQALVTKRKNFTTLSDFLCCLALLLCNVQDKSDPIVRQLNHRQMLRFCHTAHERQLLTYFSAGIDASNLEKAVNVGVDGMGIGFALHAQAKGFVGALSLDRINAVLDARDAAEKAPVAKAARDLAFLDYFSGIGALTKDENDLRLELYAALDKVRLFVCTAKACRTFNIARYAPGVLG